MDVELWINSKIFGLCFLILEFIIFGVWRSLVSVLDWGSRGREFKSHHSDKAKKTCHEVMGLFVFRALNACFHKL